MVDQSTSAVIYTWRAFPAAAQPAKATLGAVIVLAIGAALWLSFNMWWAIAGVVVLLLSLNRFFLPSEFAIDADGITARYPLRKSRLEWKDIRRFLHDEHGGYLSTRARSSRLDGFSGMHLLFSHDRIEAIQAIRTRLDEREQMNAQSAVMQGDLSCPS